MTSQSSADVTAPAEVRRASRRAFRSVAGSANLGLAASLLVLVVLMTVLRPHTFLTVGNMTNIAIAAVLVGLCALPQTLAILTGGIDLSIGSTVGLSSVVCALVVAQRASADAAFAAMAVSIGVGVLCGLFNGIVITWGHISPLIATLATWTAYQGMNYIVTGGKATGVLNPALDTVNSGKLVGIPIPVAVLLVMVVAFGLVMKYMVVGRNIYAVGGNPTAARLAGIPVNRYVFGIYVLGGAIGGVAGVILTAKQGAGIPESGAADLALSSITAVVLGGAALTGGIGTIGGTVLGVLILGVLENALLLLNVSALYQPVPKGLLLIVAVLIQQRRGVFSLRGLLHRAKSGS